MVSGICSDCHSLLREISNNKFDPRLAKIDLRTKIVIALTRHEFKNEVNVYDFEAFF